MSGQFELARQLVEDTVTRCRRILGEDHPCTLRAASCLFFSIGKLGQHELARRLGEDTLTRMRRVLGDDHFSTLPAAQASSSVWRSQGSTS